MVSRQLEDNEFCLFPLLCLSNDPEMYVMLHLCKADKATA